MSGEGLDTDAAIDSAERQISIVDACGGEWMEADQIRFVRTFIEEGIDELARIDRERFEIIAECVMLAGENMQDARLSILEKNQNEEDGGIFDFLINLGIMLALELALVSTAVYALPALIALVSGRVQARQARQLVKAIARQRDTEPQYQPLADIVRKVVDKRAQVEDLWSKRADGGETYFFYKRSVRELKNLENDYAAGMAALERSVGLAKKANQASASAAKNPHTYLSSEKIRTFMHGAVGETIVNRVAENSAVLGTEKIIEAVAGSGVTNVASMFQTSTLLGRFLAEIRDERNHAAEEWSRTRFHIHFLSDDDLVSSEIAQELFFRIHYDQSTAIQGFSFVDREFLVLGIEGALWFAWLCHIKALAQENIDAPRIVGSGTRKGEIHGDLFITDFPEGDTGLANGISYPGLVRISDSHAEYLYGRFAKSFYVANPDRAPEFAVPIGAANTATGTVKFNQLRYDEVASMSPTLLIGISDPDRLARVAEMKLLVIKFFQILATDPDLIGSSADSIGTEARKVLRELLGLKPTDDIINSYLDSLPPISEFGAPVIIRTDGECLIGLVGALETTADRDEKWLVGDARSQLEAAMVDLDLKITTYPLLYGASATAFSADRALAEDALREIERAQQAVGDRHAAFLELAEAEPDVAAEFDAQFGDRIRALTNWSPGQIAEDTWKYYPPVEAPPVT